MTYRVALAGNPNCGKTTLFNRLTGATQRVGNWPGVTIDRKTGKIRGTQDAELIDMPGIYSLSPYSPEENITRDYLLNERPWRGTCTARCRSWTWNCPRSSLST